MSVAQINHAFQKWKLSFQMCTGVHCNYDDANMKIIYGAHVRCKRHHETHLHRYVSSLEHKNVVSQGKVSCITWTNSQINFPFLKSVVIPVMLSGDDARNCTNCMFDKYWIIRELITVT